MYCTVLCCREFPHLLYQRKGSKHSKSLSSKDDVEDSRQKEEEKVKKEQRLCLAVGINEVTRAMERGQLSLALVGYLAVFSQKLN